MSNNSNSFESLTTEQFLEVLSKNEEKLSSELADLRKFHKAAWEEYGSELCAGEMFRKESVIVKKISQIKAMKEVVSSRKLNGQMLKLILTDIDALLLRAQETEASFNKDKEALNKEKSLFADLLEIVSK